MILYLDTSDLFKLYVMEPDTQRVEANVSVAERLASSRLAVVEINAAIEKARRDGRIRDGDGDYDAVLRRFNSDWRHYAKINVTQGVISLAGDFARKHGLRAGDALHLASAVLLRGQMSEEVQVSVADRELRSGAVSEGFVVV